MFIYFPFYDAFNRWNVPKYKQEFGLSSAFCQLYLVYFTRNIRFNLKSWRFCSTFVGFCLQREFSFFSFLENHQQFTVFRKLLPSCKPAASFPDIRAESQAFVTERVDSFQLTFSYFRFYHKYKYIYLI